MNHREIDLVITNERDMSKLLKFLIKKLRTIDGTKNSANKILKELN